MSSFTLICPLSHGENTGGRLVGCCCRVLFFLCFFCFLFPHRDIMHSVLARIIFLFAFLVDCANKYFFYVVRRIIILCHRFSTTCSKVLKEIIIIDVTVNIGDVAGLSMLST